MLNCVCMCGKSSLEKQTYLFATIPPKNEMKNRQFCLFGTQKWHMILKISASCSALRWTKSIIILLEIWLVATAPLATVGCAHRLNFQRFATDTLQ